MSHIPNAAMPHAAPHHHEPETAGDDAVKMTMEPTATAGSGGRAAYTLAEPAPAQRGLSAASTRRNGADAVPARSGWGMAALAVGAAALFTGVVGFRASRRKA